MTPQQRIDDRHRIVRVVARDGARRRVGDAVAELARAREVRRDAAWILVCSRELHVAQQEYLEAQEALAADRGCERVRSELPG